MVVVLRLHYFHWLLIMLAWLSDRQQRKKLTEVQLSSRDYVHSWKYFENLTNDHSLNKIITMGIIDKKVNKIGKLTMHI